MTTESFFILINHSKHIQVTFTSSLSHTHACLTFMHWWYIKFLFSILTKDISPHALWARNQTTNTQKDQVSDTQIWDLQLYLTVNKKKTLQLWIQVWSRLAGAQWSREDLCCLLHLSVLQMFRATSCFLNCSLKFTPNYLLLLSLTRFFWPARAPKDPWSNLKRWETLKTVGVHIPAACLPFLFNLFIHIKKKCNLEKALFLTSCLPQQSSTSQQG